MIRVIGKTFILDTDNTSYIFRILPTGQAEHLHYGGKVRLEKESDAEVLTEKHVFEPGNSIVYDKDHKEYSLEDMRLEMSSYGKGDIREPFVEVVHADGNRNCDFIYDSY
nr:alpha-galactosidase [Lachnospiraceae bacterium]